MTTRMRRFLQERLLTTRELSALIGVPAITIQQWAIRGKVDCVLKGRTYLFDRADFADTIVATNELTITNDHS